MTIGNLEQLRDALGFILEDRGGVKVIDWSACGGSGCRPATTPEISMMDLIASLSAQVAEKDRRIAELANHLKQSIAFITHTAAFGKQAARGILQAGNDESTRFFVEDARKLIEDRTDD